MNIKRTGIFASPEQIAHIKFCRGFPIMAITNPAAPGHGVPATIPMCESAGEAAHTAAIANGLPDFSGNYGIDLSNGEFVKPD